jgi:hypothetical protein
MVATGVLASLLSAAALGKKIYSGGKMVVKGGLGARRIMRGITGSKRLKSEGKSRAGEILGGLKDIGKGVVSELINVDDHPTAASFIEKGTSLLGGGSEILNARAADSQKHRELLEAIRKNQDNAAEAMIARRRRQLDVKAGEKDEDDDEDNIMKKAEATTTLANLRKRKPSSLTMALMNLAKYNVAGSKVNLLEE